MKQQQQEALNALGKLTNAAAIIAVGGIVLGIILSSVNSGYSGSALFLSLGYALLGLGGAFIPIAFVLGAINLHAQAVTSVGSAEIPDETATTEP